jgi:ornithine cyclodeaminase/alanine dehydrogenase-like protein (mu-crystallin family)
MSIAPFHLPPVFGGVAMALYLLEESVRDLLHWDRLISTMGSALAAFSLGRVVQPVRNMLIEEGKRYLGIMPAVADDAKGAKLVPGLAIGGELGVCINPSDGGPRVRIHLPPAASLLRT